MCFPSCVVLAESWVHRLWREICTHLKAKPRLGVSTHQHSPTHLHEENYRHELLLRADHGLQPSTHTSSYQDKRENRRSESKNIPRLRWEQCNKWRKEEKTSNTAAFIHHLPQENNAKVVLEQQLIWKKTLPLPPHILVLSMASSHRKYPYGQIGSGTG